MFSVDPPLLVLACLAAGVAALLTGGLTSARYARVRARVELAEAAMQRRREYAKRVQRELDVFDAEFTDVDIEFDEVGIDFGHAAASPGSPVRSAA